MNENMKTLKGIGLTLYEAQAYITLTSLISATATDIAEKSNIPRSKIYDVLKKLAEKKFIEIEDGRPLTYNVKSPVTVLTNEKERLNNEIDDTITRLTHIYENGMSQVQAPIWRIYGVEKIINQELEIIKRARKSINMRIGFLFEKEGEKLIDALKNRNDAVMALKKAIEVRNVWMQALSGKISKEELNKVFINEKIDIISLFRENDINIQKADIPFVKLIISDSKEMMHTYTKFSEDKRHVIPETAIGIWNKYEDIAKNYDERFMNQLKKIKQRKDSKSFKVQ